MDTKIDPLKLPNGNNSFTNVVSFIIVNKSFDRVFFSKHVKSPKLFQYTEKGAKHA